MTRPADTPARSWLFDAAHPAPPAVNGAIAEHYLADEAAVLAALLERATLQPAQAARVRAEARALVEAIRGRQQNASGIDALLREYDLSSGEGIVLMCLARPLDRVRRPALSLLPWGQRHKRPAGNLSRWVGSGAFRQLLQLVRTIGPPH